MNRYIGERITRLDQLAEYGALPRASIADDKGAALSENFRHARPRHKGRLEEAVLFCFLRAKAQVLEVKRFGEEATIKDEGPEALVKEGDRLVLAPSQQALGLL